MWLGRPRLVLKLILKGPNKAVRIVAQPSEIEKIKPALKDTGLRIRQFERINPKLVVRDIPSAVEKSQVVEAIVSQNMEGVDAEELKLVYWLPARDRRGAMAILEVSPAVRRGLLSQGRVYVGWSPCRVSDHLRITQCYKCLRFGHIAKSCRAEGDTGYCTERHESRACPNRANAPKCHNWLTRTK